MDHDVEGAIECIDKRLELLKNLYHDIPESYRLALLRMIHEYVSVLCEMIADDCVQIALAIEVRKTAQSN